MFAHYDENQTGGTMGEDEKVVIDLAEIIRKIEKENEWSVTCDEI